MSDEENDPTEALLKVHRKEKKDLQGKIQALKKTASKGDKKKKKDVADEIIKLETELEEKHKSELATLKSNESANPSVEKVTEQTDEISLADKNEEDEEMLGELRYDVKSGGGVSKAQKRREKKAAKEKERLQEIEAQEEDNLQGVRHLEQERIKELLDARGLRIVEVPSDGDCMFAGIVHQLEQLSVSSSVRELRKDTADQIKGHQDDYAPFLSNPTTGDMLSDQEFQNYCKNMAETAAWGGQVELRALATVLGRPIEVIQAAGPPMIVGEEFTSQRLLLTYHRHAYGLGEHYNSVCRKQTE